mmetsp:Transcript_15667/g.40183  ORF Transcript_15667/g.40183 Transcript_15667/m.40183 type:complete len:90 (+) Transcript_15667:336-605(+)
MLRLPIGHSRRAPVQPKMREQEYWPRPSKPVDLESSPGETGNRETAAARGQRRGGGRGTDDVEFAERGEEPGAGDGAEECGAWRHRWAG